MRGIELILEGVLNKMSAKSLIQVAIYPRDRKKYSSSRQRDTVSKIKILDAEVKGLLYPQV